MEHLRSAAPDPVIPGWRVILSDAGRFWASRVLPFPNDSEWYAPPFRTVDADTLCFGQPELSLPAPVRRTQPSPPVRLLPRPFLPPAQTCA